MLPSGSIFYPELQWRREDRTDAVERKRAAVYEVLNAGGTYIGEGTYVKEQ